MEGALSTKSRTTNKSTDVADDSTISKVLNDSNKLKKDGKNDDLVQEEGLSSKSVEFKFEYAVIDDEEALKEALKSINEELKEDPILALDCEGDNLSRVGKIQLVSIATRSKAFLIDIQALKTAPFELGVRDILEKENIKKLMFDCREDSDALFHQFNVKLDGVIDIQLLEVMKQSTTSPTRTTGRRSDRGDEVVLLKGLLNCVKEFTQDKELEAVKQRASKRMSEWGKRPLEKELLEYATVDVMSLFLLFDKLHPDEEEMKRLQIGSKIYVDLKRSIPHRGYDKYENNGYLPIDVIPEKGRTSFDYGYINCTKCRRMFPGDEFSKTQLRNGNQLCRTCKRVKLDIDTHESRMRNYEINGRRNEYDYEYDYDYDDVYEYEFEYGYLNGYGYECHSDSDYDW